jgi:hypothetical protein
MIVEAIVGPPSNVPPPFFIFAVYFRPLETKTNSTETRKSVLFWINFLACQINVDAITEDNSKWLIWFRAVK